MGPKRIGKHCRHQTPCVYAGSGLSGKTWYSTVPSYTCGNPSAIAFRASGDSASKRQTAPSRSESISHDWRSSPFL